MFSIRVKLSYHQSKLGKYVVFTTFIIETCTIPNRLVRFRGLSFLFIKIWLRARRNISLNLAIQFQHLKT
jgi:hypothetical protein